MCGVVGIVSNGDPVMFDIFLGLRALQHRGKESAGSATYDGLQYFPVRGMGTVAQVFANNGLKQYKGPSGIGHVRYSTTGTSSIENAHPFEGVFCGDLFYLAHNGNLVNTQELIKICAGRGMTHLSGMPLESLTDSALIVALISSSQKTEFYAALSESVRLLRGTFSLVILYKEFVYGVRDVSGNRPLVYAEGRGIGVLASESALSTTLNIRYVREIAPGEIVRMAPAAYPASPHIESVETIYGGSRAFCVFEHIYFLRPDSSFVGLRAQLVRECLGKRLWEEHRDHIDADVVISVPDSGNAAAQGFSLASGIPRRDGLMRSHTERTFNDLYDRREVGLQIKFGIIPEHISGKRVCVVDDSLVRASTMRKIVGVLREAGAAAIYVMISAPLYTDPCYYGIDTYRVKDELAAKRHRGDIEGIRKEIRADKLCYLSTAGLSLVMQEMTGRAGAESEYCMACFTGKYPMPISDV